MNKYKYVYDEDEEQRVYHKSQLDPEDEIAIDKVRKKVLRAKKKEERLNKEKSKNVAP